MLIEKSVHDFITELAAESPAPGGGSAAALAGCLGAALTAMVCKLSLDEAKFEKNLSDIKSVQGEAAALLAKLTLAIDEDAQAFSDVMDAYKLPKGTETEKTARMAAIQASMKQAALLPLEVAGSSLAALRLARRILPLGNSNAASDAAVAGLLACAAVQGALYNVKINLSFIKDVAFCSAAKERIVEISAAAVKENAALEEAATKLLG